MKKENLSTIENIKLMNKYNTQSCSTAVIRLRRIPNLQLAFWMGMFMLCLLLFLSGKVMGQAVANKGFIQSSGTFPTTLPTGGTRLTSAEADDGLQTAALPFSFTFNGTSSTAITVSSNGFIYFGSNGSGGNGSGDAYSGLNGNIIAASSANTFNVAAALNLDLTTKTSLTSTENLSSGTPSIVNLQSAVSGLLAGMSISGSNIPSGTYITAVNSTTQVVISQNHTCGGGCSGPTVTIGSCVVISTSGSSPNFVTTIRWTYFQRKGITGDNLTFAVKLYETSNNIEVMYGSNTVAATSSNAQVGLKGSTNADFNTRKSASSWASTTAGTANTDAVALSSTVLPASGLTFTWVDFQTSTISTSLCQGFAVSVPYTTNGVTYGSGNVFTAELSNSAGSFASPTTIGTLSSTTSGTISATISSSQTTSSGYRIRVVSSNPSLTSTDNGSNITVLATPTPTFTTAPNSNMCLNIDQTYTTQAGQNNYVWSIPGTLGTNYIITAGGTSPTDNTVTLQWLTVGTKAVTVNYTLPSTGCAGLTAASNTNVAVTCATITVTGASSAFSTCPSIPSAVGSYTVSGTQLTSDISITAPAGYQISLFPGSGFTSSLTLLESSGTVSTTTIYVRLNSASAGSYNYSGTNGISHVSSPAPTQYVSLNGTVNAVPVATVTNPSGTNFICSGTPVTLSSLTSTAGSGTISIIQWIMNGTDIGGQTGTTYIATAPGTYSVRLTNSNGCVSTSSDYVIGGSTSPTAVISPDYSNPICIGNNVQLSSSSSTAGSNAITGYNWIRNGGSVGSTDTYSASVAGSYLLIVIDAAGCVDTSDYSFALTVKSDPLAVTENPLPGTYTVTGGGTYCSGGSGLAIGLDGSQSGFSYQLIRNGSNTGSPVISTGGAFDFPNQTAAGTYTVVATDITKYTNCTMTMTGSAQIIIAAQPVGPTINVKTPDVNTVCDGTDVSATFNAGSGGVGCSDDYIAIIVGGSTPGTYAYTAGNPVSTSGGVTSVAIRGRRNNCTSGLDCNGTSYTDLASWSVVAQPVGPTLNTLFPSNATVCAGTNVSATFTVGSGGDGCSDDYIYIIDGGTPVAYTPGNNISTSVATVDVIIKGRRGNCTANTGCTTTSYTPLATWTVIAQPFPPTLDVKTPNLSSVCQGTDVSATTNPGSGGDGCSDDYIVIIDGGTPGTYTPGDPINTTGVSLVQIKGRRNNCTANSGCSIAYVLIADWTITPPPLGPSLNIQSPTNATVCAGTDVSATFTAGSGGCTDDFIYIIDGGTPIAYTPGSNISTSNATVDVVIQGRRANCPLNSGCSGTSYVTLVTWNVIPQPVGPTLNLQSPVVTSVCVGTDVSATFNAGSGGDGCSDDFIKIINGGAPSTYNPGDPITTTSAGSVLIRGRRNNCTIGSGCSTSYTDLATWTVVAQPTTPSVNVKSPAVTTVCVGTIVSATANAGAGGDGCSDDFIVIIDGGTPGTYTPGDPINTTGTNLVEIKVRRANCTTNSGCNGTAYVSIAIWNVVAQPVGPALNTQSPTNSTVCAGAPVTATFTAGSGGDGCSDDYVYIIDGGTPLAYTPGSNISTSTATADVVIKGRRANCTANAGCNGTSYVILASWTVIPQPNGPSISVKFPDVLTVCEGTTVSATSIPGSGGDGCSDDYIVIIDGGTPGTYTPGDPVSTTGVNSSVVIRGRRNNCTTGSGCSTSYTTLASWNVVPQPVGPTLNTQSPTNSTACAGTPVSATFMAGSGGDGCSDDYIYIIDSGTPVAYSPGSNIPTSGATVDVVIKGRRASCTTNAGCNGTAYTILTSWTVIPQPVGPTLDEQTPSVTTVCVGTDVSALFNAGSGGNGCSDDFIKIVNGGAPSAYNQGDPFTTTSPGSVVIRGRRNNCTIGSGCSTAYTDLATWTVIAQPLPPTINVKSPDVLTVCEGTSVNATSNPGSGGDACSDDYIVILDGGIPGTYTPGDLISTTGLTSVEIKGRRNNCTPGSGCSTGYVSLAIWSVVAQPVGPTLNNQTPTAAAVCSGDLVNATFNAGSGGFGCSDDYVYILDGGAPVAYTPGSNINTTGASLVEIKGRRNNCTANSGCNGTSYTLLADWNVNPLAAPPTITYSSSLTFCHTDSVILTANGGVSYLWSTGEITSTIVVKTTGSTTVFITADANGCVSSGSSAAVVATVYSLPTAVITGATTQCAGQGDQLSATSSRNGTDGTNSNLTYQWYLNASPYSTSSGFTVSTPGTYSLIVTNTVTGCLSISCP